jgi:hypothetical protein
MTFRRAINGLLGDSVARLIPAGAPGTSGTGGGGPAQFTGELNFHARVTPGPDLATEAQEVAALASGTGVWHPTSRDFKALCKNSSTPKTATDVEVANSEDFLAVLARPVARFNFVAYSTGDGFALSMPMSAGMLAMPDFSDPTSGGTAFNSATIAALQELAALSSGGGVLADRLRALRKRNKDFHQQHGGTRENLVLRDLWLVLMGEPPTEAFAKQLARTLMMRIVIYDAQMGIEPTYTVSPKRITGRGHLIHGDSTGGTLAWDLHTFDQYGIVVEP